MRGTGNSRRELVSIVPPDQLKRISATLFDEDAFLSPHGLRAISKATHAISSAWYARCNYRVRACRISHGNVVAIPTGPDGVVSDELSGHSLPAAVRPILWAGIHDRVPDRIRRVFGLRDIAGDLADRLVSIWLPGPDGPEARRTAASNSCRPTLLGKTTLVYEYFHGDNGAGLGAMHQTG